MRNRLFPRLIRLTYGITVCNEAAELERLIAFLLRYKDWHDEIVVLQDVTQPDPAVTNVLTQYRRRIRVRQSRLDGDFSAFKNQLIDMASGDYLFQIDADELPGLALIRGLKKMLMTLRKIDSFAVPRVNFVDGITPDYVARLNWQIDDRQRINFPDYQMRIFQLKRGIHWENKVHERLVGQQVCHYIPVETDADDQCLMHRKSLSRQVTQNNFYDSL